nr:glycosyltransferase family 2 protein [uncultured Dyadobacter sp.]
MAKSSILGVAIPTYKRENYLRILLDTIPANVDVVVSDNGGFTSAEFKQDYSSRKFIGSDVVVNMFQNWNNAINGLDNEWICLASDDDIFYPNAFQAFDQYLAQYADSEIIIFGHNYIDETGKKLGNWKVPGILDLSAPLGYNVFKYGVDARPIAVFFKKELFQRIGELDVGYKITSADSDFIQLALLHGRALFVPEIVSGYRIWSHSLTNQLNTSTEWMAEVTKWQDKIKRELQTLNFPPREIKENTDEVFIRNLLSGLLSLRAQRKGILASIRYLKQFRYPRHATLTTQLKILQCLLKTALNV